MPWGGSTVSPHQLWFRFQPLANNYSQPQFLAFAYSVHQCGIIIQGCQCPQFRQRAIISTSSTECVYRLSLPNLFLFENASLTTAYQSLNSASSVASESGSPKIRSLKSGPRTPSIPSTSLLTLALPRALPRRRRRHLFPDYRTTANPTPKPAVRKKTVSRSV